MAVAEHILLHTFAFLCLRRHPPDRTDLTSRVLPRLVGSHRGIYSSAWPAKEEMPEIIDPPEPRRGIAGRIRQIRQQSALDDDHVRFYTTQSGKVLSRSGKVLEILPPPPAKEEEEHEFEFEFQEEGSNPRKEAANTAAAKTPSSGTTTTKKSPTPRAASVLLLASAPPPDAWEDGASYRRRTASSASNTGDATSSGENNRAAQLGKQHANALQELEMERDEALAGKERADVQRRNQRDRRRVAESELAEVNSRCAALEHEGAANSARLAELESELLAAKAQGERYESQFRKQRDRRRAAQHELASAMDRLDTMEGLLLDASKQQDAARERRRSLERELAEAVAFRGTLEAELAAAKARSEEACRLLEGARAAAELAEERAVQLERDCRATVQRQKDQMQKRIDEENARLAQTLADLENDRCRWRALAEPLQAGLDRTQGELQREQHRTEALKAQLQRERADAAALRTEYSRSDAVHKEVVALMSEKNKSLMGDLRQTREELQQIQSEQRRALEEQDAQIQALKRERNSRPRTPRFPSTAVPVSLDRDNARSPAPSPTLAVTLTPMRPTTRAPATAGSASVSGLEAHSSPRERRTRGESQLDREIRLLLESNAKYRDVPDDGSLEGSRAAPPREAEEFQADGDSRSPPPREELRATRRLPKRKRSPAPAAIAPSNSAAASSHLSPSKRRSTVSAATEPSILMQLPPPPPSGRPPPPRPRSIRPACSGEQPSRRPPSEPLDAEGL